MAKEYSRPRPEANLLALQRLAGNQAVVQLLSSDRSRGGLPSGVGAGLSSPATPLDPDVRAEMEAKFGCDLSLIRVHQDSTAARAAQTIHARAYTFGDDIVFGAREYAPQSPEGRKLLAHELAHAVQQRRGSAAPPLAVQSRGALELDADRAATSAVERNGVAEVAAASAPGIAMQASEGWYEWAMRQWKEWSEWAFPPSPSAPPSKEWINRQYQPRPPVPPDAVPRAGGTWHELPNGPHPVPEHAPEEAAEQMRRRQPQAPGQNEAVGPDRPGDPGGSPERRAMSQAQREPRAGTAPARGMGLDPADAPTEILDPIRRERLALNSALANPELAETMQHERQFIRRGRGLRRGSATVGGMVFTAVMVGSTVYFLSQSENLEDLIDRAADVAAEAVVGAALFRLMGPASAFLMLEGDNPEIARNRQTMNFIYTNFGHYFESDPATGEHRYTGPGDFETLFHEAYDLLFNTDAIALPSPPRTHGYAEKGSMAPVRLR